jgi:hypothetical protein
MKKLTLSRRLTLGHCNFNNITVLLKSPYEAWEQNEIFVWDDYHFALPPRGEREKACKFQEMVSYWACISSNRPLLPAS